MKVSKILVFFVCYLLLASQIFASTAVEYRNKMKKANELMEQGFYYKAADVAEEALKIADQVFEKNSSERAETFLLIGKLAIILDRYDEVVQSYAESIEIDEKLGRNKNNLEYATKLKEIARYYKFVQEYDKAYRKLEQADKAYNDVPDIKDSVIRAMAAPKHTYAYHTPSVYVEIGDVYFLSKDFASALDSYRRVLQWYDDFSIEDDLAYAKVHEKIGDVYFKKKDYGKAVQAYNKAHSNHNNYKLMNGEFDVSVSILFLKQSQTVKKIHASLEGTEADRLAFLDSLTGRRATAALSILREFTSKKPRKTLSEGIDLVTYEDFEIFNLKDFPEKHRDEFELLTYKAFMLCEIGKYVEASEVSSKAIDFAQQKYKIDAFHTIDPSPLEKKHLPLLLPLLISAEADAHLNRLRYFLNVVDVTRRLVTAAFGENHPLMARIAAKEGEARLRAKDSYEIAINRFEKAVSLSSNKEFTVKASYSLAKARSHEKSFPYALAAITKAIDLYKNKSRDHYEGNPFVAELFVERANILEKLGERKRQISDLQIAEKIYEQYTVGRYKYALYDTINQDKTAEWTAYAQVNYQLAQLFNEKKDYSSAKKHFQQTLDATNSIEQIEDTKILNMFVNSEKMILELNKKLTFGARIGRNLRKLKVGIGRCNIVF